MDALFRSKYLLTASLGPSHHLHPHQYIKVSSNNSLEGMSEAAAVDLTGKPENPVKEISNAADQMHRVTILNLPEQTDFPSTSDAETSFVHGSSVLGNAAVQAPTGSSEVETYRVSSSNAFCMPIVPWINGDGTINKVVYRGLIRRVLGIIMLNPGILEVVIFSFSLRLPLSYSSHSLWRFSSV